MSGPQATAMSVNVCDAPFANVIAGQVTTLPDSVPPLLALTKVVPAGSVSVTTTFVAVDGPAFVTVSE